MLQSVGLCFYFSRPCVFFQGETQEQRHVSRITRGVEKSPEPRTPTRWKSRNDQSYEREKRKRRRNSGKEYTSKKTRKTIEPREIGPPCLCKNKCRKKLGNTYETVFTKFWDLGSFDLQNSYLFGCIRLEPKKRSYKQKQKRQESRRKFTAQYMVNVNGEDVKVCKVEFMSVHGLQKSRGRINNIVKMKSTGAVVPNQDGRGKHKNRPNKISDEQVNSVKTHIDMIPKYQSHYSRNNNLNKTYLNCDMTISGLYNDYYVPWCEKENILPIKESAYRKIFCTSYNIGFKLPKSDTCKTCDEMNIKIDSLKQNNNNNVQEVQELITTLNIHKFRAKGMQDLLKLEADNSKRVENKLVISFDLQQAMPVPKLTTGPAFYSRKIWLYNLGVHDCTNERGYMYVWTEDQAKRGADEIISAVLKFLEDNSGIIEAIEELIVFTDNCPGQNKNWQMMSFWLQLIKEKRFKQITHYFLVSGHTHLPSDRDFAKIEKRQRKHAPVIYSPEGWHKVIREANKKNPFVVTVMTQDNFFSFEPLLHNINKNARSVDKRNLDFSGVYAFHFKVEKPGSFFIKHTINGDYQEINVLKKGRPANTSKLSDIIKKKYTEPIKIAENKLANIRSLLPYIPPIYHPFYNHLNAAINLENSEQVVEILDE